MKRFLILCTILLILSACIQKRERIVIATSTSVENTGLLRELISLFEKEHSYEVIVIATGTGAALQNGKDKEADLVITHAKELELSFVSEGYGVERIPFMYNYFCIVGPSELSIRSTLDEGLEDIIQYQYKFISRGDQSGTHMRELSLWELIHQTPKQEHYYEVGQGMSATLMKTDELEGFTLTDKATFLTVKENTNLQIKINESIHLYNEYAMIVVAEAKNQTGAQLFQDFVLRETTLDLIDSFGINTYGEQLFYVIGD